MPDELRKEIFILGNFKYCKVFGTTLENEEVEVARFYGNTKDESELFADIFIKAIEEGKR